MHILRDVHLSALLRKALRCSQPVAGTRRVKHRGRSAHIAEGALAPAAIRGAWRSGVSDRDARDRASSRAPSAAGMCKAMLGRAPSGMGAAPPFSGSPGTPNGAAAGARGRLDVSDLRMPHRRRPWEAPRRRPATRIRQGLFILGTPVPQSGPWQQSRGESVSYVCFCALEGPELEPLEPKWLRWTDDAGVASFVLTACARTFVSSATATAFPCNIVLRSSQASIII